VVHKPFRPPHIYKDNAIYFITACTFDRKPVLVADAHKRLFRDLLKEAVQSSPVRLYTWAVLRDHYHLLLLVKEGGNIGNFIRRVNGSTSRRLNELDCCSGRRVWRNYWDRFPRNEAEFWAYFNYTHVQPIKHGEVVLGEAGDIHAALRAYEFSSYHYYLREYGEEWLTDVWARYPIPDYLMMWDEQPRLPDRGAAKITGMSGFSRKAPAEAGRPPFSPNSS
jgi:putative transposase